MNMDKPAGSVNRWLAVLLPGIAMSLGWGLRGQYGGPRGAMVPGALVAMALALASRRRYGATQFWAIAAAGALGFGIGGEETYMQTVAVATHPGSMLWGCLGILIKGAEWGGLGGLFIGMSLSSRKYKMRELLLGFNLALILGMILYHFINEPKLIYFSGHAGSRPRDEGWAGISCVFVVLLALAARCRDQVTVRLGVFGAIGGGAGFLIGVLAYNFGQAHLGTLTSGWWDWWKVAECGFGLIAGIVLGWAWWSCPQEEIAAPEVEQDHTTPVAWLMVLLMLDLLVFYMVTDGMDNLPGFIGAAPFIFTAPFLLLISYRRRALTLAIGAVMPIVLTIWNVKSYWVKEHHLLSAGVGSAVLLAAAIAAAVHVAATCRRPAALFVVVAAWTTALAWLKMGIPAPGSWGTYLVVQGIFTVMLAALVAGYRVKNLTTQS
ncbi:MAG: hypothetical protein KGJ62_05545 [Armatimonadetes bacterium]|nr:hypothetical protein [Armatimonadota bacterium]MDE2207561.1 hypothetical protein [Armatimonadota bacterium]